MQVTKVLRHASRVVVGMSGGVDSTVAALLLKQQGYDVVGAFMRNWDEREETGVCTSEVEYDRVQEIANFIGIQCHRLDFVTQYWHNVFMPTIEAYEQGLTPNPDILCNVHVKFDAFYKAVRERLDADYVATGHYAAIKRNRITNAPELCQPIDRNKDQTYFLAGIPQSLLHHVLMPLSELAKGEVKALARDVGLAAVADQPESMGLCFIGKRNFGDFAQQYVGDMAAVAVTPEGMELATVPRGLLLTIGQGAKIMGQSEKLYVVSKDMRAKTITVAPGRDNPALFARRFSIRNIAWTDTNPHSIHSIQGVLASTVPNEAPLMVRTRHRGPLVECSLVHNPNTTAASTPRWHELAVSPKVPLRAIVPGQYAVFYKGGVCLGRGEICASS
eukprot:m.237618 g.237618  ORF g.237618 m.237618 type:complete len:389 (-) comp15276_c0_seq2:1603-2769(-)